MMGPSGLCCDEEIIHILEYIGTINTEFIVDRLEQMINHCLECGWGICKPKVHNIGLKEAIFCLECCFVLITFFDTDIVVPPPDIEFSKDPGIFYLGNQIRD